jgi:hypothetical protein
MTNLEPPPASPPGPPFQFSLRTLLLLFVVLGSSLAVFGMAGIVVFAAVTGLAIYFRRAKSPWSLAHLFLIALSLMCLIGWLLLPFINSARDANRRASCANHLHQLGLALHDYHTAYGCFPPAYITDKSGKPLHSWRALLLPFMEYSYIYEGLDLTQPWDAPKNNKVVATQLREYECPSDAASCAQSTSYVAVVGPNAAWAGDKSRKLADFGDDPSGTIMLLEVVNSGIGWAEPRDFLPDASAPGRVKPLAITAVHYFGYPDSFFFKYDHGSGIHVVTADGKVRFLRTDDLTPEKLRQILQIGGCREGTLGARALVTDASGQRLNWPNIAALAVWLVSVGTLLIGAVRGRAPAARPDSLAL